MRFPHVTQELPGAFPMKAFALILSLALPAQAAVIGVAEHPGGRTDFHDEVGVCANGAHRAVFVPDDGKPTEGCWALMEDGEKVRVALLDGRAGVFPLQALRPVKAV